jgi:NitT/TauT family transport system substrate-binding protein
MNPSPTPLPPLDIGYSQWAGYAGFFIAADKGYFKDAGVAVNLKLYDVYDKSLADFASKRLDGVFATVADMVGQASAGVPIKVIWVTDLSKGGDVVVGNADLKTPQDLKGRRIGLSYGTYSQIFVLTGLQKYGLTPADVQIINLPGEQIPAAIAAGKIDAGHTWDPHVAEVLQAGGHKLFTSEDAPVVEILCFNSDVLNSRPNDIKAILKAVLRGLDYWHQNKDDGDKIIAKAMGVQPADLVGLYAGDQVYTLDDNLKAFDVGATDPITIFPNIKNSSRLFIVSKVLKQVPDATTMVDGSFIQALNQK